ncbi:MAG TPA: hypothetical protein P5323_02565 [Candidatus Moranbacteria bacterium]|nr:hypothetical protein [Candidatus Moranbacteria bacterium]HRY27995.1 hypothetical protein [Candidatus Moranbacteria bacterium]HSA08189.1 hypothetical protein [Candidatus Moranbacteria bacterium]
MGRKWDYLRGLLKSIFEGVPAEISFQFESLFPSEARFLTLGEKAAIYSFITDEKTHDYILESNRPLIGDFLIEIDNLTT